MSGVCFGRSIWLLAGYTFLHLHCYVNPCNRCAWAIASGSTIRPMEMALPCTMSKHPSSWSQELLLVEYTYNTPTTWSTGLSPFQCSYGYQPLLLPALEKEVSSLSVQAYMWRCHWTSGPSQNYPSFCHLIFRSSQLPQHQGPHLQQIFNLGPTPMVRDFFLFIVTSLVFVLCWGIQLKAVMEYL